jgi:hypothetical protein
METPQEVKAISETPDSKRHKILFYLSIAGVISLAIGTGTVLIATGELKQAVVNTKEADKSMLDQIKSTSAEVTSIKINQDRRDIIDSMFRVESRNDRAEIRENLKLVQSRLSRLEYSNHLKPFEPSQLFNDKKLLPFDVSQLSLQNYNN